MRIFFWVWVVLVGSTLARGQEFLNCHFVPGWEPAGSKRDYTPDNLFDYRDGAAEGYLQFGFEHMRGIDCKSGATTMAIDVSEMSDAEMAFGMFSANRDPRVAIADLGMGGQIQAQSLTFAKGRYYVELVVTDAAADADFRTALQAFASEIEKRLTGESTRPTVLTWFPAENLTEVRLVPESVLGVRLLKRGYVAKYREGQAFLVEEASREAAAAVLEQLKARYPGAAAVKIADDGFQAKVPYLDSICIFRKGRYVAGYTNLANPEEAAALSKKLAQLVP